MATNGYQNAVNGRPVTINEHELQPMAIELRLLQFKNNLWFFRICGFPTSEGRIWYLGVPEIKQLGVQCLVKSIRAQMCPYESIRYVGAPWNPQMCSKKYNGNS